MLFRVRRGILGGLGALALLLAPQGSPAMSFSFSTDLVQGAGDLLLNAFGDITQSGQVMTWTLNEEGLGFDGQGDPDGTPVYVFDTLVGDTLLALDPSNPLTEAAVGRINFWQSDLKVDPFVTNNFNFTNTSGGTALVNFSTTLPIPGGFDYTQIVDSSIGITVTDSNGNAVATVTENGSNPIYSGRINNVEHLALLSDPYSLGCSVSFPGCSGSDSENQSPDPLAAVGNATEISIWVQLLLSPGDTVGVTSRFEIVPEPGTALLLGLGLGGLALVGRRSSR